MPKTYNIKWSAKDAKKLSGKVRSFNTKRTKLIKLVPELEDILPPRANVNELRESILTRNDLNKVLARLDRFLIKGAEDTITTEGGIVTTKYQINELKIQQRTINQIRAAKREKADPSTLRGTMGSIKKMNLRPKTLDIDKAKKESWDNIVNTYEKQSMDKFYKEHDELYKENYLIALEKVYGSFAGYKEVEELVKNLPANTVVDMYFFDPNLQMDFLYPIPGEDASKDFEFYVNSLNDYLASMKDE